MLCFCHVSGCKKVVCIHFSDVVLVEGDQHLCLSGAGDEFDFNPTLGIDLDDRADVTGLQAMLRNIMNQHDTFE